MVGTRLEGPARATPQVARHAGTDHGTMVASRVPSLHALSLFVRWAHVAGMAAILGGALLVCGWGASKGCQCGVVLMSQSDMSGSIWAAIGVQAYDRCRQPWGCSATPSRRRRPLGDKLIVKLIAVLALAVLSPRTLAVVAMAGVSEPQPGLLSVFYGGTASSWWGSQVSRSGWSG